MKSQSVRVAIFSVFLLTACAWFVSAAERPGTEHKLTKKEAKALLVKAKTPEDHLKLAGYFQQEAQRQEAKAKYHDEMGELYRLNPPPNEAKMPWRWRTTADHCKHFADEARKVAEQASSRAEEQERLAAQLRD